MKSQSLLSILALSTLGLVAIGCAAETSAPDTEEAGSTNDDLRTEQQRKWAAEVRSAVSSYVQCKRDNRDESSGMVVTADGGVVRDVPLALGSCEAKVAPIVQPITDACIASFQNSPFQKGHAFDKLIPAAVTVFGVGVAASDTAPTTDPQLVVIASGTNVLGNVTYQLTNPNAYYCIISATSVLGNLNIQVKDKSHLAMVRNSGAGLVTTSVMGNVTVEEVR